MTNEKDLIKILIKETIEDLLEQNALAAGGVSGTSGAPIGMKPEIFDPEKPKTKKKTRKNNI